MSTFVLGPRKSSLTRKPEFGHRVYKATWVVMGTTTQDGPASAILTPGLPQYGDTWAYGTETDPWAWCRYDTEVTQLFDEKERGQHWEVTFTFSTEPDDKGCIQQQIQNPLLQPPKLSGNFTKFREEATKDKFGKPIFNSSFEQIRGPQVEFDDSRPTVKIEMNVASLNLPLLYSMRECVNAEPMWGFPPRCIKLSQIGWTRQFYGVCFPYYQWNLEFEINPQTWDKDVTDVGTSVLYGEWDRLKGSPTFGRYVTKPFPGFTPAFIGGPNPDPNNPQHFVRYRDLNNNYTKVLLNGAGLPAGQANGFGATGICEMLFDNENGTMTVESVIMTSLGQNYTQGSAICTFSAGAGGPDIPNPQAAVGTPIVTNGQITGVTLTTGGFYFITDPLAVPTVTFQASVNAQGHTLVQKYYDADFTLLGIPLTLGP